MSIPGTRLHRPVSPTPQSPATTIQKHAKTLIENIWTWFSFVGLSHLASRPALLANLRRSPEGAAPGPGGYTAEILRLVLDDDEAAGALCEVASLLARAKLPSFVATVSRRWGCGASSLRRAATPRRAHFCPADPPPLGNGICKGPAA